MNKANNTQAQMQQSTICNLTHKHSADKCSVAQQFEQGYNILYASTSEFTSKRRTVQTQHTVKHTLQHRHTTQHAGENIPLTHAVAAKHSHCW